MIGYLAELAAQIGYEQIDLEVVADNTRAQALYRKCGFAESGRKLRALKFDDVCSDVVDIVKKFLKECDFQVWFPEPLSEDAFYTNSNNHGMQLVSQNLIEGAKFMETVFRECDKRPLPYVCAHGAFGGLILLGCRVHRCPLPPHFVQLIAKAAAIRNTEEKSTEHAACKSKRGFEKVNGGLMS